MMVDLLEMVFDYLHEIMNKAEIKTQTHARNMQVPGVPIIIPLATTQFFF